MRGGGSAKKMGRENIGLGACPAWWILRRRRWLSRIARRIALLCPDRAGDDPVGCADRAWRCARTLALCRDLAGDAHLGDMGSGVRPASAGAACRRADRAPDSGHPALADRRDAHTQGANPRHARRPGDYRADAGGAGAEEPSRRSAGPGAPRPRCRSRPRHRSATGPIMAAPCRASAIPRCHRSRPPMSASWNSPGPSGPATCPTARSPSSISANIIPRRRRSISATRSIPARRIRSSRRSTQRPGGPSGAGRIRSAARATPISSVAASPSIRPPKARPVPRRIFAPPSTRG